MAKSVVSFEVAPFSHPFSFSPTPSETIAGWLELSPVPKIQQATIARDGVVSTQSTKMPVRLYSNAASNNLLYLHQEKMSVELAKVLGLAPNLIGRTLTLPGQTILSGARVKVVSKAVAGMLHSQPLEQLIASHHQHRKV